MKKRMVNGLLIAKVVAVIVIFAIIFGFNTSVKAAELSETEPLRVADGGLSGIISAGNSFINKGKNKEQANTSVDDFATALAPIGSVLAGIGIVIFMAVLGIMAIKWITAKPDDKAKLKQAFVGYVVAAVVFFGAVGIWRIAIGIMEQVEGKI